MRNATNLKALTLGLVLSAVVFVYLPGLFGPFVFDDWANILNNPYVHLDSLNWTSLRNAALSTESALFGRPLAVLSFALNYYLADGFVAFDFKLTNLVIHGINGILVFLLARRVTWQLTGSSKEAASNPRFALLPLIVATLWLLHPLQLTSVLYVVQRMNSLSAMFVLVGLLAFFEGRSRFSDSRRGGLALMAAGIFTGAAVGVMFKENALLLPIYAGVIELACFSTKSLDVSRRRQLRGFYGFVLGLPVLLVLFYIAAKPGFILDAYQSRTFTPLERLLTQPRVLFYYLGLILFPSRHELGLFHDDFPVSSAFLSPLTTPVALLGWICLVILALRGRSRTPVMFLTVAWFLCGHAMESTVLGLEMIHEHRNYLPSFGPIFGFSYAALAFVERVRMDKRLAYGTFGLIVLTLGFITHSRATSWSTTRVLLESLVNHHPESARAHLHYSEELVKTKGDLFKIFFHLQQSARLSQESVAGLAEMIRIADALKQLTPEDTRAPSAAGGTAGLFEVSLTTDRSRLAYIQQSANDEIERRLETQPVTAGTVDTFRGLRSCLYEGRATCVSLASDMARWIELTLSNPRMIPQHRAILLLTAAKIHSWSGNTHRALAYAELAAAAAPGQIHFLLNLAELHLTLGDRARALDVVERIKREGRRFNYRMDEVVDLEARLKSGAPDKRSGNGASRPRAG
jgi:hypothetical protein